MLFKHRRSLCVDGEIISGVNDESLKVLLVIRKGGKNWHGRSGWRMCTISKIRATRLLSLKASRVES